jgi:uncharacterized protein (TIGR02246 family)
MDDDEKQIRELIATWLDASAAANLETVLELMSEDAVFLLPGQPPMRGRAAYAEKSSGQAKMKIEGSADIQEIAIRDDLAYCWNHLTITVTPAGGSPVRRSGPVLTVFRKESDGRWRLYRDANLLTAE